MNSTAYVHTLSDKVSDYFSGRRAVFAADDSQDYLAVNVLKAELGLEIIKAVPEERISVEITSKKLPAQYRSREILRQFAKRAMVQTGSSIGIASSIYKGRDSVAPFLNIHSESLIFLDDEVNLELFERSLSNHSIIKSRNQGNKSKRPLHTLFKRLSVRLKQVCPECSMPGWGITFEIQGLKCSGCGLATREVQSHIWSCTVCRHSEEIKRSDGLTSANPDQCYSCSY